MFIRNLDLKLIRALSRFKLLVSFRLIIKKKKIDCRVYLKNFLPAVDILCIVVTSTGDVYSADCSLYPVLKPNALDLSLLCRLTLAEYHEQEEIFKLRLGHLKKVRTNCKKGF